MLKLILLEALNVLKGKSMRLKAMLRVLIVTVFALNMNPVSGASERLTAKWIWAERDDHNSYNDFIIARKTFTVREVVDGQMIITADTRYRLFVNDQWVNDGPCRSWPNHYQYDVLNITPYLNVGENEIRIIANYFGTGTFHQLCQQAGLLVELDVKTAGGDSLKIVSDDSWGVADVSTWVRNVHKKCVQMGPYEIYDARKEGKLNFKSAMELFEANGGPWKDLNSRDCRLLSREPFSLKRFVGANVVADDWMSFGFRNEQYLYPGLIDTNHSVSMLSAVATVIRCDKAVTLHFQNYPYGNYHFYVNGNRTRGPVELKAGAHFFLAVIGDPFKHWFRDTVIRFVETKGFDLENPLDSNKKNPWCFVAFEEGKYVNVDYRYRQLDRAEQEEIEKRIRDVGERFAAAATDAASFKREAGTIALTLDSDTELLDDPHLQFQARRVIGSAAKLVKNCAALMHDNTEMTVVQPSKDGDIELVYDFGEQNCGYYEIDLIAEEGLQVDLAQVEYINPAGEVQHTAAYRNSMRYICKEGHNEFVSLWRRSGRYMFIYLRNQTRPVSIRNVRMIESTYPVNCTGYFRCSDPTLDKLWEISARTLKLCMEDTFTDCPLFEQTFWVGDSRNEAVFAYTAFGAEDLARRCILLAGQSLEKYPIVLSQVPSTWETLLPAWSYLWGCSVWDYYFYTGDKAFIEQIWPMVIKNLEGAESGGYTRFGRVSENMLLVGAVNAALKCADVLGDAERATWLREYRARLVTAINASWDDDKQGYVADRFRSRTDDRAISLQASSLCLIHDIVEEKNHDAALRGLLTSREGMINMVAAIDTMHLFEALEKEGHEDLVIELIREKYRLMMQADATTVWERFHGSITGEGGWPTRSHCHAWSSMPVHFLNRIILGIMPTEPGGKAFRISPRPNGLSWAKGASATIKGPVEVSWRLSNKTLSVTAKAPEGVHLTFVTNDSIAKYDIVFNDRKP